MTNSEMSDNENLYPLLNLVLTSFLPKKFTSKFSLPRPLKWLINNPHPAIIWSLITVTYFIMAGGIIYDVINTPPAIGQTRDPYNPDIIHTQFIFPRMNSQYRNEGFTASGLFVLGAVCILFTFAAGTATRLPSAITPYRGVLVALGPCFTYVILMALRAMYRKKFTTYLK